MQKQYIHEGWTLTDKSIEGVLDARVPGCFHTDLINAGIIKDIYYRDNSEKYEYLENCSPVYQTRFDAKAGNNVTLKFEGLDTFADIYLNGKKLGSVHNMFIPHSFDVTEFIREKDNLLRVEFCSPIKAVEGMPVDPGFAFTGDRVNARRIQCTYGWDWVARFVTMGIFRPVYLEYREGIEIEDVYIRTDAIDRFGAAIVAEYTLSGSDKHGLVEAEIVSQSGKVVYKDVFYADRELVVRKMDIASPELWYPRGYGEQPLYTFRARSGESSYETAFGIRTLRILNLQDENGTEYYQKALEASKETIPGKTRTHDDRFFGFKVIVNGEQIFCKGGNWVPCEPFPSEESDEKIRALVASAAQMGVNILRVWGGGLFEKRALYNECDKQGILICHDFLMACAHYPEKEQWFIDELLMESEFAIKYLRNHPSVAWFHGDNENAVDGSDLQSDYTGRSSALNGIYPSVYKYAKHIPFLESSPWGGNTFSSITSGTSHNTNFIGETFEKMYSSDCSDYKEYLSQFSSRFVSEEPTFGAICRESMLEFMTEADLLGDDESILKYHAKTNPGLPIHIYDNIRAFTESTLGTFTDGEDRFFKMKYIQCEWVRVTFELVLRNLGYSNGIIYWMFNDCWPASIGWAFVDYYLRPKPSYYAFKRLSGDVIGSIDTDGKRLVISNTSGSIKEVEIVLRAVDIASGETKTLLTEKVKLGAYSTYEMATGCDAEERVMLVLDTVSDDSTYRSYCKRGKLEIERCDGFDIVQMNDESVTIRARRFLQCVEFEGDYTFSDNYFTMLEGELKTVNFKNNSDKKNSVNIKTYTIK